jgi:TolB-like protein/class 3 adenylate cyclase
MSHLSASSRILTLVFTDLSDSTALKTQLGDQAVRELIQRHRALVRRLAGECDGRIIDWAGDGCFLTFESSSAAVVFALRLQQAHGEAPDLPGVRIGMHMGEVSDDPGAGGEHAHPRVEGLAVDLAARVAGLAQPGQVLLSAAVANSARGRIEDRLFRRTIGWRSHGNHALKGFDEPLEVREVGLDGVASFVAPAASDKAAPVGPRQPVLRRRGPLIAALVAVAMLAGTVAYLTWPRTPPSVAATPDGAARASATEVAADADFGGRPAIAVLPFDNMSADPEQAFFADGIAEDLITRLSTWRAFPVIARNSSFQHRGGNLDLKRISAELGARYLVEGSVRRAGDRIRVTAQLIDATTDQHVWAQAYERPIADLFALQDEISSTIAASLVGDLTRAEGERARQRGTDDLEAWSLYQLGMQHANRYTLEEFSEAGAFFKRAVERDPRFATAWGQLALSRVMEIMLGATGVREAMVSAAFESARRAVELDARDPVAHAALGGAYLAAGDPRNGIDSTQRAVDLNPSMPEAWIWLGWAHVLAGNPEAAIAASERARRLNPQGPMVWIYENLAIANWEIGRHEEGLDLARQLVATQPAYFTGYAFIAMNAVALGQIDEARAAIAAGRRVRPDLSLHLIQGYFGVSRPEFDTRRNVALRQAGLE